MNRHIVSMMIVYNETFYYLLTLSQRRELIKNLSNNSKAARMCETKT